MYYELRFFFYFFQSVRDLQMLMIMIMNLYSAKTIEEYLKALYIKMKHDP